MPAGHQMNAPEWDSIVSALKKWRNDLQKTGTENPSVTTVAERYKNDPWAVLVSTILSLRTKDEVTLKCSQTLLAKAPTPQKLLSLEEAAIAQLIYPAGFYRTKAANLKKIAALLIDRYKGKVPADLDTLLGFPGVGRKTANLVLIEAYDLNGICVDVHVHRISNRTGWLSLSQNSVSFETSFAKKRQKDAFSLKSKVAVPKSDILEQPRSGSKNPEETEMILRKILPLKHWKAINPLLVLYGQNVCRPVSPYCSRCVIAEHCKQIGVGKSR